MKFYVNSEWLESIFDLEFIRYFKSYETMHDEQL